MNHEMIESFIEIVNLKSTSAAARSLFVSQSTISHRIQMLESELGSTLFDRQRGFKRMELTEAGKRFYPLALKWLELNSQMHQINKEIPFGSIRIGSMDSINQFLLPQFYTLFRERMSNISLQFVSYHSHEIYSRLSNRLIDVGFAFYPVRYEISAIPVISEPMYMVSPPNSIYPDTPIHPSQLEKKDQILFTWDENSLHWNDEWWDENSPPFVKVDSCALLTTFLTDARRWTLCPASVATSLRAQYNVKINTFSVKPPNRVCYMLLRKGTHSGDASDIINIFVDQFNEWLTTNPWRYSLVGSAENEL